MRNPKLSFTLAFLLAIGGHLVAVSALHAQNWPDFRGPTFQGHSDATLLPVKWSETENVRWKTEIPGKGWSTPVIWEDQLWLTTATEDGKKLWVLCLNRESGIIEHQVLAFNIEEPEAINALNSYASPSPVVDAERVYAHFGTYGTAALDRKSGRILWVRDDLKLQHKEGPGSSPILDGDRLIVTCDGMDVQYTIALDVKTGATIWRTDRSIDLTTYQPDTRKAYATPLLANVAGRPQLISPGAQAIYGYDPQTGEELWRFRYSGFSNVARPLIDDEHIYINTGYTKPLTLAIKLGGSGDITDTHLVWKNTQGNPNKPTPVLIDGLLYLVSDNGGVMTCLDAKTGEKIWSKRLGGNFSASPLVADGRIYLCDQDGKTYVLKPGREYEELAVNELSDGFMASPIAVGNALYLRTKSAVYRIEKPEQAAR
jgi:outer membrane protein assembly factor BamB